MKKSFHQFANYYAKNRFKRAERSQLDFREKILMIVLITRKQIHVLQLVIILLNIGSKRLLPALNWISQHVNFSLIN